MKDDDPAVRNGAIARLIQLGPAAIGALLELDGMPQVEVGRLMAETRGLPMLVREYIEALRSAGDSAEEGRELADWWPPASVRGCSLTSQSGKSSAALRSAARMPASRAF